MFDESDIHETPTGASSKESQNFFARLKRIGGSKSVKYQAVELNAQRSACVRVLTKNNILTITIIRQYFAGISN